MFLTMLDLAKMTGVSVPTMHRWIAAGILTPTEKRDMEKHQSKRNTHEFDLMASVGVVVAGKIHQTTRSCSTAYITQVSEAFASLEYEWLQERLFAGRIYFTGCVYGIKDDPEYPIYPGMASKPAQYRVDWINVQEVLDEVVEKMAAAVGA